MKRIFYIIIKCILTPLFFLIFRPKVIGKSNIPKNGSIVLAGNHTNNLDSVMLIAVVSRQVHFLAKIELFKNKLLASLLDRLGAFGVDRDGADISAVRAVMKYVRAGEKVGIFPEGTRVSTDGAVVAKPGAVRIAAKLRVPVVPVFVSRRKWIFRKVKIVIGEPIAIPANTEDFQLATNELMEKISEMGRTVG